MSEKRPDVIYGRSFLKVRIYLSFLFKHSRKSWLQKMFLKESCHILSLNELRKYKHMYLIKTRGLFTFHFFSSIIEKLNRKLLLPLNELGMYYIMLVFVTNVIQAKEHLKFFLCRNIVLYDPSMIPLHWVWQILGKF